jgi:flap endonuclease-1
VLLLLNRYQGPLLKNLTTAKEPLVLLRGSALRAASFLSPEAFLDFCILLGTDASPRIPKLGPVSAFKAMQKYGSIEAMLASDPTIAERVRSMQGGEDGWMELVRNAREVFRSVPPIPDGLELGQGKWDEEEVERWLEVRHGISFVDPEAAEGRVEEFGVTEEWDEIIASENVGR